MNNKLRMITLDQIRRPVEPQLEEFKAFYEEFAERQFHTSCPLLEEMLRHTFSTQGKAVRPLVVLLSAALNAPQGARAIGRRTYLAALLIEMIHTTSLVHDDVLDESDSRRGKPTANALWQSKNAVLLGDYLLSKTISAGLQSAQYDLVDHVSRAVAILCEGELLQGDCARRGSLTREEYFRVIHLKTAALFGISASAGALSVRAPRERVEQMRRFGEALGDAFQIQDDLLDYTRSAATGKPVNNDLREGKITLPLLAVLERCDDDRRRELLGLLRRAATEEDAVDALQRIVETEGGLDEARRVMHDRVTVAIGALGCIPGAGSPAGKALADLCLFATDRNQ